MTSRLHHLNFVVRDLDAAIATYQAVFALPAPTIEDLPSRAARTARFQLCDTWLVLVQPLDPNGAPGRHLAEHGEGLFLVSFSVGEIDEAISMAEANGARRMGPRRTGLADWILQDIEAPGLGFGSAVAQLCVDRPQRSPVDIVDEQLAGYNAHDLDRFVATYSTDVEIFRPPGSEPVLQGRAALARFYATNRFCHVGLRAEILKRLVVGNLVSDHERIHGLPDSPIELIATYEIQEALIRRVWLLSPAAR